MSTDPSRKSTRSSGEQSEALPDLKEMDQHGLKIIAAASLFDLALVGVPSNCEHAVHVDAFPVLLFDARKLNSVFGFWNFEFLKMWR